MKIGALSKASEILCFIALASSGVNVSAGKMSRRTLWLEPDSTGRVLPHLNKSADSLERLHAYSLQVPAREVRAGQMITMNDRELTEILEDYRIKDAPDFKEKIFYVIRAGTVDHPFYQLLGGHNRFRRALAHTPDLKVRVTVVADFREFSHLEQVELLSVFGNFWTPENPHGLYRSLTVTDTTPSPWRSLVKIPWVKKEFGELLDKSLVFPEVEFGRRLYLLLRENGFEQKDLSTLSQVVDALKTLRCGHLLRG